jgi:drug/metabolite transporter (DMT)-like permease
MPMPRKTDTGDWLLLALLVVAWGSSFAMSKHALSSMGADWVMALRLAIAAAAIVAYAYWSGLTLAASRRTWLKFTWLGFIGNAFPFLIITWGMHFITSGVAGLLMGAIPLFVVLLAHFTLPEERMTIPKAIGFVLGFAGILVLIGPEAIFTLSLSGDELKGELAVIFGCLCYAVHGISAKRLGVENPVQQSAAVCLAGAVMGLAFALVSSPAGLAETSASAFAAVLGLGLVPTAFATVLVYRLMERRGPSFVSLSNYLVPVFALALGALLLREPLGWNIVLALLLILAGIAISRWAPGKARAAP